MSLVTWHFWLPDLGVTAEDAREFRVEEYLDAERVAQRVAEYWWHRDGDYSTCARFCLRAPDDAVSTWELEVESEPVFRVRKL